MLRVPSNIRRNTGRVTEGTQLFVGSQESLGRLIMCSFILSSMQIAASTISTVVKGDGGLQLRAIQERVCTISNTRGVIVSLIVVRKGSPLGASVNDSITEDQATRAADHITGRKFFLQVGRKLFAFGTDHRVVEVLLPCILGTVGHFDRECKSSLAERLGRSLFDPFGFSGEAVSGSATADEEWRIQFGGVERRKEKMSVV